MTQPALDRFKKRNALIKAQPTENVDPTPTGGSDAFRFFNGETSTEFDKIDREEDRQYFGNYPFGVANRRAKIGGEFELYPPATPGQVSTGNADCEKILLPSGMAVTKNALENITRYSPISDGVPMVAARFYHTGTLLNALNCRGDISSLAIEIGQRFKGKGSLLGNYTEVVAAAAPAVTLPSKVPVVANARNTRAYLSTLVRGGTESTDGTPLGALLVWAKMLSVDFGNDLKHKEYSSKAVNKVDDRKGKWSMRIAKTDITDDFNPWYVRDNAIVLTASMSLYEVEGATPDTVITGLYSKLAIRGQIETITPTDIDGDYGWELSGPCIPTDSGNDEFYIEFGDDTP